MEATKQFPAGVSEKKNGLNIRINIRISISSFNGSDR